LLVSHHAAALICDFETKRSLASVRDSRMSSRLAPLRAPARSAGRPRAQSDAHRPRRSAIATRATGDVKSGRPTRRRELINLSLLTGSLVALLPAGASRAEENVVECFLDVAVEGEVLGRVTIAVDATTLSGRRFAQLCKGERGLSYRRTTLDSIEVDDNDVEIYLKNGGVQNFVTPGSQSPVDIVGGPSAERLLAELDNQRAKHDRGGLVSLIVRRDPNEPIPEPKARLVSVRGKFETVYDPPPPPPNGTAFVITLRPAPELDATNVIVGKIIGGEEVLNEISQLPTVKDNTNSPFFAVAKSIGDKRALVAEQSFRKPFKQVRFTTSGIVEKAAPTETPAQVE